MDKEKKNSTSRKQKPSRSPERRGPAKPNDLDDWGQPLTVTIPQPLADITRKVLKHAAFRRSRGFMGGGMRGRGKHFKGHGQRHGQGRNCSPGRNEGGFNCNMARPPPKGFYKGGKQGDEDEKDDGVDVKLKAVEKLGDDDHLVYIEINDKKGKRFSKPKKEKDEEKEKKVENEEKVVVEVEDVKEEREKDDEEVQDDEEAAETEDDDIPEWVKKYVAIGKKHGKNLPAWARKILDKIDLNFDEETEEEKPVETGNKKTDKQVKQAKSEEEGDDNQFDGQNNFSGIPPWLKMGELAATLDRKAKKHGMGTFKKEEWKKNFKGKKFNKQDKQKKKMGKKKEQKIPNFIQKVLAENFPNLELDLKFGSDSEGEADKKEKPEAESGAEEGQEEEQEFTQEELLRMLQNEKKEEKKE